VELRLAEREERLSAILDTVVDGIVSVDREGTVGQFNAAAERLFRCDSEDAAGQPLQRFLRPGPADATSDDVMAALLKHIGTGHANACLCEGVRADGESFPTEVSGSEIDHLGIYVLLVRDLSERRELQRQIIETSSEEQQRIGREIHDGLGQEMAAAAMMASALAAKLEGAGRPEAALARDVAAQVEQALKESKAVSRGLAPIGTKPEDLIEGLRTLTGQIERSGELTCSFRYDEELNVADPVTASNLYRIAQEALSNAVRHGKPSRIRLELTRREGQVQLTVRDNGRWVERRDRGGGGLGLQIMSYRAAMLGGTLTVRPLDEGGTLLQCNIPLR
jgi:two-component system CheB/CheR fusion protein